MKRIINGKKYDTRDIPYSHAWVYVQATDNKSVCL